MPFGRETSDVCCRALCEKDWAICMSNLRQIRNNRRGNAGVVRVVFKCSRRVHGRQHRCDDGSVLVVDLPRSTASTH